MRKPVREGEGDLIRFCVSFFGGVVEQYDIAVVLSPVRLNEVISRHNRMVMMVYFCEFLSLVDYSELRRLF